jgi:hypothetical protein
MRMALCLAGTALTLSVATTHATPTSLAFVNSLPDDGGAGLRTLEEALVPAPRSGHSLGRSSSQGASAGVNAGSPEPTPLWNVDAELIGPAQPAGSFRLFDGNTNSGQGLGALEPRVINSRVRPRYAKQRDLNTLAKPAFELRTSELRVRELDVERLGGGNNRDGFFIPTAGSLTVAGTGFLLTGSMRRRRS